ncbi:MAG: sulfatase family protein [Verrucomicrobiota bacterium JB025]|nr:sulfatase-like hydrolase/transferase [Verrucomicrobiota bacterium JB025]
MISRILKTASLLAGLCQFAHAAAQPNVVIFLADDLGYGDLGCYGHPYVQTPHIDAFADEGVRLTDCHSAGTVCSPSRASLLTGRTPYRVGFYSIAGQPKGSHLLKKEITLAKLLQAKGYDTCFVGKWHLGHFDTEANPGDHGFDHWFATEANAFDGPESPGKFVRNGEKVGEINEWYCDAIVKEATDWLAARPDQDKPFFLLVCSHEPHTPIHPPESYSDRYDDKRIDDQEVGIGYGQVHRPLERDISGNKKYFYGTVTQLDDAFGRLVKAIDDQGHKDDSMVVFTSDNGPETPVTVEESNNEWEDPIRDRCFGTPGAWRGMKRYVYEGGHRVPGIVRWPGTVKAGTLSSELVNGTDWMPTVCAATGIPLPDDRVIDGVDIVDALAGKPVERPVPACWTFPVLYDTLYLPSMAMREGSQVLVGWFAKKQPDQSSSEWVLSTRLDRFALYDLSVDRSQSYELSAKRPEDFERMKAKMVELFKGIQKDGPEWKQK